MTSRAPRTARTGYHLVDPRPWPIIVRAGVMNEAASFIRFVHGGRYTLINFICATWLLLSSFYSWIIDIITEATYLGCHTSIVARGFQIVFNFRSFLFCRIFLSVIRFWNWKPIFWLYVTAPSHHPSIPLGGTSI